MTYTLHLGDCRELLRSIPANSISSIVTDPPYHLTNKAGGFLGYAWDATEIAYSVEMWSECLRVLKPGGHLLAFGAPRTYHRTACAIEDAGFEIRDQIMWIFSTGASKSLNIAKAVERTSGLDLSEQGPWIRQRRQQLGITSNDLSKHFSKSGKPSGNIRCWETGYGTPTPAQFNKLCELLQSPERKIPETELKITGYKAGTSSANHFKPNADHSQRVKVPILEYQTDLAQQWQGYGSNIAPAHEPICMARKPLDTRTLTANILKHGAGALNIDGCRLENGNLPSNVIISDQNQEIEEDLNYFGKNNPIKFFYSAKASKDERSRYLPKGMENPHPTVKPLALMRYLCRLVTPKGGTILDPFMGSGSCGLAAFYEGFRYIGIEMEHDYFQIAECRLHNQELQLKNRQEITIARCI